MYLWTNARRRLNRILREATQDAEHDVVDHVGDTTSNYRLIADYHRRPVVVDKYVAEVKEFNRALTAQRRVLANDTAFPQWLSNVLQMVWVVVGGDAVWRQSRGGDG